MFSWLSQPHIKEALPPLLSLETYVFQYAATNLTEVAERLVALYKDIGDMTATSMQANSQLYHITGNLYFCFLFLFIILPHFFTPIY